MVSEADVQTESCKQVNRWKEFPQAFVLVAGFAEIAIFLTLPAQCFIKV